MDETTSTAVPQEAEPVIEPVAVAEDAPVADAVAAHPLPALAPAPHPAHALLDEFEMFAATLGSWAEHELRRRIAAIRGVL